ncbi:hypothetical protein GCM10011403_20410 [Pseudohongiella nitratireducens]|uniref:Uncharacterized protein n=1 Tax=Pseudohongiella nitratireducens TaxID=1768907 RepID=A0A916QK47_9GAMM|nr:hypothetical protein GCM10011403_20410 [Pseudohongiella nitratireducens]
MPKQDEYAINYFAFIPELVKFIIDRLSRARPKIRIGYHCAVHHHHAVANQIRKKVEVQFFTVAHLIELMWSSLGVAIKL